MNKVIKIFGDDISLWIEQETVHLRAVDRYGDPIEMTPEMCKQLATELLSLSDKVEC